MKKPSNYLISIIVVMLMSNIAFADNCDWSTIKTMPNLDYEYSPALHLCVGNLVESVKTKDAQINDLNAAIQLKDLAIAKADQRTQLWQTTADNEQDRLSKIESSQKTNDFWYFTLGVVAAIGTGWMASRLMHP